MDVNSELETYISELKTNKTQKELCQNFVEILNAEDVSDV